MKESGINYFWDNIGLSTGYFNVFYTFEEGAGSITNSVSGAQSNYTGIISSPSSFWRSANSGFFSGSTVFVSNASALNSQTWTKVFAFEKIDTQEFVLFNSMLSGSGFKISVNPANKLCFESFNTQPILATSSINLSTRNIVSFAYLPNSLTMGYYNPNAKSVEYETFNYPFSLNQSDNWVLGGGTGYMDYFIHCENYISQNILAQVFSGFWNQPTGMILPVSSFTLTGVIGYQSGFTGVTGITGYVITPSGDQGRDYFTGAFPTYHTEAPLTGFISSGIALIEQTGSFTVFVTGSPSMGLNLLSGYVMGLGMDKIQLLTPVFGQDILKYGFDRGIFNNFYNIQVPQSYDKYALPALYDTGQINLFINGIAQANTGWASSGGYIAVDGGDSFDYLYLDAISGSKQMLICSGSGAYVFPYTGQELFVNGINLVSGYDFTANGQTITILSINTGIFGYIFEYPYSVISQTGNFSVLTTASFLRNTTNLYTNGLRQRNYSDYIEGSRVDLLSGNYYNDSGIQGIYGNTNLFWE